MTSMFEGASNFTINGNFTNKTITGGYSDQSRQTVTNNYGAHTVYQTNYNNSNNDYSTHQQHYNNGHRTTVHNINSHNTTQTSYTNSNNDNSNTAYGYNGGSGGPQYFAETPVAQGWPQGQQGSQYVEFQGHPGMQDDSQTGRYPSVPPFYYSPVGDPGNYQLAHPQAQVPPKPSKHRPRKGKDHLPNANDFNQQQYATEVQHEAAKRGSRSTAAAFPSVTNTNPFTGSSSGAGYDAAGQYASGLRKTRADGLRTPNRDSLGTQQQQYAGAMQHASRVEASIHVFGGQKAQSQTTPSGQFYPTAAESAQQGSSSNNPFHPAPPKKLNSKPKKDSGEEVKEKESDKGKGKKPQRATVETTDDEDDYPSPNHRLSARERNVQTTLGPVLESLISTDDDDDIGDILEAPPVRNLRPLSVPNTPSPQAVGNPNTASTANASKQQRPLSTPTIPISSPSQSTSVHHNARPAASAVATPLASTSGGATSAPAGKPLGPTPEEERLAQLAADFTRMSSSLSTKDGKKKKKGLFSKMNFLKKKEKHEGGVVGIISVDGD